MSEEAYVRIRFTATFMFDSRLSFDFIVPSYTSAKPPEARKRPTSSFDEMSIFCIDVTSSTDREICFGSAI